MRHVPYRARKINPNTYVVDMGAVCFCYLLVGEEKALVIDTGMNPANLREYLETITDKPMEVVNTHGHCDHDLCNGYFDKVWMHPNAIKDANNGDMSIGPYAGQVPDFTATPVEEGHIFDLGGRHVEVLYTECHSPGDLMFLDKENRMLFTGDNLEVGQVLIFYGDANHGATVEGHLEIMKKIKARYDEYDIICPAHNGSPIDKSYVDYYIENDERILSGIEGTSELASPTWNVKPGEGMFGLSEAKWKNLRCSEWKGTSLVYDIRKVHKEDSEGLWAMDANLSMGD